MTMTDYDAYDAETGEGLTEYELHQRYDEMLNDIYGEVDICGLTYGTARTLREVDPIAYRCGYNDWLDSEMRDGVLTEDAPEDEDEDEEA